MPDIRTVLASVVALVAVLGAAGYVGTKAYDASDTYPTGAQIHDQIVEAVESATSVRIQTKAEKDGVQVMEGSALRPEVRISLEGGDFSNAEIVAVGDQAWQRADACIQSPCAAPPAGSEGKWTAQDAAQLPTIAQVLRQFTESDLVAPLADDTTRATREFDGEHAVYKIGVPGKEGLQLVVTADGHGQPVAVLDGAGQPIMEFSEWDSVDPVEPPPADQVIEAPAPPMGGPTG